MPRIPRHIIAIIVMLMIMAPLRALSELPEAQRRLYPYKKTFVVTAYYSPLPGQCCYAMGSEEADKIMNGEGVMGADGTPVYPGMAAAPKSYPFGTTVVLPGLGTLAVHDRGGAINELEDGSDRLDVWVGYGEEGLIRAMNFGVQTIQGTVYPNTGYQPKERIDFNTLPASPQSIADFKMMDNGLLDVSPRKGDNNLSTLVLQQTLNQIGYTAPENGVFDDATQAALQAFIDKTKLEEPSYQLTEKVAAYLLATKVVDAEPLLSHVEQVSSPSDIKKAQRLLRFLKYYTGRTDGVYDADLASAITAFQTDQSLLATGQESGAGVIGPVTKNSLIEHWQAGRIEEQANKFLFYKSIYDHLAEEKSLPDSYLKEGYYGEEVKMLQKGLAALGYFELKKANGSFGPMTKAAVIDFQLDNKLIKHKNDIGAGYVGPGTLTLIRRRHVKQVYSDVRSNGIGVL